MVQLLYYSNSGTSTVIPGDMKICKGGFLFSFNIVSGEKKLLHMIYPQEFTKVENLHDWASRMALVTKTMLIRSHTANVPDYTWDNSAYLHSTPLKLLPHPTYPFILVNDLLNRSFSR